MLHNTTTERAWEKKMTNIEKLKAISTPAEEDWFKIAEEWEQEDNAEEFRKVTEK